MSTSYMLQKAISNVLITKITYIYCEHSARRPEFWQPSSAFYILVTCDMEILWISELCLVYHIDNNWCPTSYFQCKGRCMVNWTKMDTQSRNGNWTKINVHSGYGFHWWGKCAIYSVWILLSERNFSDVQSVLKFIFTQGPNLESRFSKLGVQV